MTQLIDPKDAFLHVVYEYRCLVRAQFAYWESERNGAVSSKIPELGTVARNAVLAKARCLVDFYTKDPRDKDIALNNYFGGDLKAADPTLYGKLALNQA